MREGPIVVGVDGSPESMHALAKMVELVGDKRVPERVDLVIVFVRTGGWAEGVAPGANAEMIKALDDQQAEVEAQVRSAMDGVDLTWRLVVREGDPAHELVKEAEEQQAAGISVGGHRHSTIGGVLVHSVESRLVHAYDGSLLIMRDKASSHTS